MLFEYQKQCEQGKKDQKQGPDYIRNQAILERKPVKKLSIPHSCDCKNRINQHEKRNCSDDKHCSKRMPQIQAFDSANKSPVDKIWCNSQRYKHNKPSEKVSISQNRCPSKYDK